MKFLKRERGGGLKPIKEAVPYALPTAIIIALIFMAAGFGAPQ